MSSPTIDWMQLLYIGPRRCFSANELCLAGQDRLNATFWVVVWTFGALALAPLTIALSARIGLLLAGLAVIGMLAACISAKSLWAQPTRKRLNVAMFLVVLSILLPMMLLRQNAWFVAQLGVPEWREQKVMLAMGAGAVVLLLQSMLIALTFFRSHQIEARLTELAERSRREALAYQLAGAQIQPHFLFNSLAALQHWVQTQDARAAPLLESLTGYLRATLPLFQRERLALGEELPAVRRYLEVFQARLGERLRWQVDVPLALLPTQLPPALLLTLVENAVEHGVQQSIHGAEIVIRAYPENERVIIEVQDTGPGFDPLAPSGTGLTNSRARLAQAYGTQASLELHNHPTGGCIATLTIPSTL